MQSGRVDLREYLARLASGFAIPYPVPVRLDASGNGLFLDPDRAIHVGLNVNELVTNAQKHAFPAGRNGEATVRLRPLDDHLELQVRDNGVGIRNDLNLAQAKTLGLHILARRLNATVTVENHGGGARTAARRNSNRTSAAGR